MARWDRAYLQMRALEAQVKGLAGRVPRDGYALVMGPQLIDGIPFASNAQAGLILPPFNAKPISDRVLVQIYLELPNFAGKIREGLIPTLRSRTVDDYIEGRRIRTEAFVYPSEVYCWDTHAAALMPVAVDDRSSPEAWVAALRRALAGSACEPVRY
jgi:hypothetical protein